VFLGMIQMIQVRVCMLSTYAFLTLPTNMVAAFLPARIGDGDVIIDNCISTEISFLFRYVFVSVLAMPRVSCLAFGPGRISFLNALRLIPYLNRRTGFRREFIFEPTVQVRPTYPIPILSHPNPTLFLSYPILSRAPFSSIYPRDFLMGGGVASCMYVRLVFLSSRNTSYTLYKYKFR
jgi:hypothetical protein